MATAPRCLTTIWKLLKEQELELDKYKAAKLAHCDQRTAQRILTHLHVTYLTRISDWIPSKGSAIPKYVLYDGIRDAKKPNLKQLQAAQRKRRDSVKKKITLGIWGI